MPYLVFIISDLKTWGRNWVLYSSFSPGVKGFYIVGFRGKKLLWGNNNVTFCIRWNGDPLSLTHSRHIIFCFRREYFFLNYQKILDQEYLLGWGKLYALSPEKKLATKADFYITHRTSKLRLVITSLVHAHTFDIVFHNKYLYQLL